MSEKTLKFNNIRLNKNEFHKSKEPVVSDKFKHKIMKALSTLLVT